MFYFHQVKTNLKRVGIRVVCLIAVAVAVWGGAGMPAASAMDSNRAVTAINDRAAAELDRVAGAGTSDQIEGTVDSTIGRAKRDIGRVGDSLDIDSASTKLDGATDQLKGKIKRDIGRTKANAADIGDDIEDATSGIVESVKDLFD